MRIKTRASSVGKFVQWRTKRGNEKIGKCVAIVAPGDSFHRAALKAGAKHSPVHGGYAANCLAEDGVAHTRALIKVVDGNERAHWHSAEPHQLTLISKLYAESRGVQTRLY